MAPFYSLPDAIGLFLWNLLNGLVLFTAIWSFRLSDKRKNIFILGFIFIEMITAMQNSQSNALIAGLIIHAFNLMEKKKLEWAALLIILTFFIKIYGIIALILFLFYPNKIKAGLYSICWFGILFLIPLLKVSMNDLLGQYENWIFLLKNDHSETMGVSVSGLLYNWFGFIGSKAVLISGMILFLLPLIQIKKYSETGFRQLFLASILIWIVIFNHKAESSTFIIAVSGVALWFFSKKQYNFIEIILLIIVFLLTILSSTDLFPGSIRKDLILPYSLKVFPCILVYIKILFDMFWIKSDNDELKIVTAKTSV